MSYDQFETSIEGAQTLELYQFAFGADVYRFTSYNSDVTWGGLSYQKAQISRSKQENAIEDAIKQMTITVNLENPVAQKFIANVPGILGTVQVLRANANDVAEETVVVFDGFVAQVKNDAALEAQILCQPLTNLFQQTGPRFKSQGLCNHVLYDQRCKVVRALFTYNGTVTGVSGSTITVNGLSANGPTWAVGGFAQAPSSAPEDKRMILSQSGDDITLLLPFSIPVLGIEVGVLAGCDHTIGGDCLNKFSNTINFGGSPYVPRKNPFNSTLRGGS